jgi:2-haloalkanoic acid dehalogenase type II
VIPAPKWIAFDLYTTLINREAGALPVVARMLERLGAREVDPKTLFEAWHHAVIRDYRTRFVTWKTAGRRVMPGIGERFGVRLRESHADEIFDSIDTWPEHPDVNRVLSLLGRSSKLAVVTNMDTDLYQRTRLSVRLDAAVTSEMAGAYKPHPRIFEQALRTFGCTRDEILWVGTAPWADVIGARMAELPLVWIRRDMGHSVGRMELAPWEPLPDYEFPTLDGLLTLIRT